MNAASPPLETRNQVDHFFARWRVRITVLVFLILVVEDLAIGVKPHDLTVLDDPYVVAGIVLVVMGLLMRSWAAGTLRKRKVLADIGPYSLIRHPLYLGTLLVIVGFCVLIDDVENIWIVLGPFAAMYVVCIRHEEQSLARKFNGAWNTYVRKVPPFIPRRLTPAHASWSMRQWAKNREYRAVLAVLCSVLAIQFWAGAS